MKQAARLQTSIEILDNVFKARIPMDRVMGDFIRGRRYIGSGDRAAIAEYCYNIMRHYARLTWMAEKLRNKNSARDLCLIYLVLYEELDTEKISAIFNGDKYAPIKLNNAEEKTVRHLSQKAKDYISQMPEDVKVECPPDFYPSLKNLFGKDFINEMRAMLEPATLDLRVNIARKSRDEVMKSLANQGVACDPTPYSPWGLRCRRKVHLAKTRAFRKGEIEIQDEGSQLIALLTAACPGEQILDYCAGGGGKTLAIASSMAGKGRLVATDIDGQRLQKTRPRLKRAGLHDNVEVRPLDEKRHHNWLKRQKGNFDCVLVDAPCSGTGTWRRNPDARWFRHGPPVSELISMQAGILDKAADIPKPGGRLVYATCSLLSQENENQIKAFLERHPNYEVLSLEAAWPENQKCPDIFESQKFLMTSPYRHNTDGFFAAVLKRN